MIVNIFWPDFSNPFQYWCLTNNIPFAIVQNWPLLLYALILAVISLKDIKRIEAKEIVFVQDIYKSVMAGVLEEIGYRCLFIFTAMIPIAIINFVTMGLVMWLYNAIMFPIVNIVTLGLISGTIWGFPALFIAGAISANATFRDGHKYQGIFGYINAWFVGFYILHIMLTQGLLIAILVHIIYDLIFAFVRYWGQS